MRGVRPFRVITSTILLRAGDVPDTFLAFMINSLVRTSPNRGDTRQSRSPVAGWKKTAETPVNQQQQLPYTDMRSPQGTTGREAAFVQLHLG